MDLNLLPYGIAILVVIPTILVLVYVYKLHSKPKFQGPPMQGSARVLSVQSTGTMINQRYVCRVALGVEVPGPRCVHGGSSGTYPPPPDGRHAERGGFPSTG